MTDTFQDQLIKKGIELGIYSPKKAAPRPGDNTGKKMRKRRQKKHKKIAEGIEKYKDWRVVFVACGVVPKDLPSVCVKCGGPLEEGATKAPEDLKKLLAVRIGKDDAEALKVCESCSCDAIRESFFTEVR